MATEQMQGWPRRRMSRRNMLRGAGLAAVGGAGIALGAACGDDDGSTVQGAAASPGPSAKIGPVEQNRIRRFGTGLIAWDPEKTYDGYTIVASLHDDSIYLVDMEGETVHSWKVLEAGGARAMWYADLLENGNLFVLLQQITGDAPQFVFKGSVSMEVAWNGNILWELVDEDQHHDAQMLPNGNLLVLRAERVPEDFAARVPGGLPAEDPEQGMWGDYVVERTLQGEVVWEWHAWEHMDPEKYPLNSLDQRNEWTHGNSIHQMRDGNVLLSFRNINTVVIVERETGDVIWELTAPVIAQQHDAHELENGNILLFDNGAHRLDNVLSFSRVLEIDVETKEVVWNYADPSFMNFFSPFISGAQRLPNGNTLVTEGNFGRIFEVTEDGEIVWEYVNPHFVVNQALGEVNHTFRSFRYAPERFPELA